jgi:hypothetical protein
VSYEQAFEALKDGDFLTAVPLLETAARETGYTSDVINHAYTLALYRADNKPRLAEVSFRIGTSMLEHDEALAMDYFQRALFAGLEADKVRRIGEIFEGWVTEEPRATLDGRVIRVAHIVGALLPGHAPAQYLKMLVSSLKKQGIASTIFTTEWAASWFFNPASVPQSRPMELEAEVKIAAVDGDFVQRAEKIAEAVRSSGIHVAFFHGSLNEQITARVAAMRPVAIQINVNHGTEMDVSIFDGRIHLFQNAMERTRFEDEPAEWVPIASDVETRIQMSEPLTRQAMGLESASTISATFGNLQNVAGAEYLGALCEIMNRSPKHFHLFAGAGNVRQIRSRLHSEGVLPRIRFLGHLSDVAPILDVMDVYLAPFPHSGGHSILEAMGAGKPVVVLRFPPDSPYNSGAELVGIRELIAPGRVDYIEIADRLLRKPEFRAQQSEAIRQRFRSQFRPERLGERYKAFLTCFEAS